MTQISKDSPLTAATRTWLAVLGVVAAIVQLVSAPWSLEVRVAVFAALLQVALLLGAYYLGVRYGRGEAQLESLKPVGTSPSSSLRYEELVGSRFIKIALGSGKTLLCHFREEGSLDERLLPLSRGQANSQARHIKGTWSFGDDGLHITVGGYHLQLRPNPKGIWRGQEIYGENFAAFAGAIVNPERFSTDSSWVALRLNENGSRALVTAETNGQFRATDLSDSEQEEEGRWRLVDGWPCLDGTERSAQPVEALLPGILIGKETAAQEKSDFVLVRILPGP